MLSAFFVTWSCQMAETLTEQPRLRAVADGISLLADLNRGDALLYEPIGGERVRLVAQARPHSVPPIHPRQKLGREQPLSELPAVATVIRGKEAAQGPRRLMAHRSHIVQRAYAVQDKEGNLVGVLALEKSLVEHERHLARRAEFQRAVEDLRDMVLRGETEGMASLSAFRETDGVLLVSAKGVVTYVSGLATYHYRRLGYSEELIGKPLAQLTPADTELVHRAMQTRRAIEEERQEEERIWIRKVIPLVGPRYRPPARVAVVAPHGVGPLGHRTVLVCIHDATAARRKAEEQIVRQAMVQEIHHRVKNNLQTVASLLRIQARRAQYDETRLALQESINRILSIAVVHEYLSQHEKAINMRDVAHRIAQQVREGILDPTRDIRVCVEGDPIFLHAHQTTMIALVINELILNSLEHGFGDTAAGEVVISFTDEGDRVSFSVRDNGSGLPENFDPSQSGSLGLRIVKTIVEQDLRGAFDLRNVKGGAAAIVSFTKAAPETFG
jgi:two-component system, sensor histidine kinase PdtaS